MPCQVDPESCALRGNRAPAQAGNACNQPRETLSGTSPAAQLCSAPAEVEAKEDEKDEEDERQLEEGDLDSCEIEGLVQCHDENPVQKFVGVCNKHKEALDACFRREKQLKRAANFEKSKLEKERLRERRQIDAALLRGEN
eukprot:jgi/Chlat1/6409/Chrsp45S06025